MPIKCWNGPYSLDHPLMASAEIESRWAGPHEEFRTLDPKSLMPWCSHSFRHGGNQLWSERFGGMDLTWVPRVGITVVAGTRSEDQGRPLR